METGETKYLLSKCQVGAKCMPDANANPKNEQKQGNKASEWPQGSGKHTAVRGANHHDIYVFTTSRQELELELKLKSGRSWIIYRFCRQLCHRGEG
eukprot:scaffold113_cov78-Skeletonema_dohrnii-CCMP3373.AAC.4